MILSYSRTTKMFSFFQNICSLGNERLVKHLNETCGDAIFQRFPIFLGKAIFKEALREHIQFVQFTFPIRNVRMNLRYVGSNFGEVSL